MLGVPPGPRPEWAQVSINSHCTGIVDFCCLALFVGYPGLVMDVV